MLKLWDRKNGFVYQESCMFAGTETVRLLFPAAAVLRVWAPATGCEFFPGKDYEHVPGSDEIRRLPGSRIPFLTQSDLRPGKDAPCFPTPGAMAIEGAVDGGKLIFNNENFFAENQISVDYRTENLDFQPELSSQSDRLPRFRKKLKAGKGTVLHVTLIGDSISEGFNSTSFTRHEPFAPDYSVQTCRELEDRFRVRIDLRNLAIGGTGCREAEEHPDRWRTKETDLYVIAYGMNDFFHITAEEFIAVNRHIAELAKAVSPDCEFLFINSMTGNPGWKYTVPGKDAAFAEAMRTMVSSSGPDMALADVQKVWSRILERKSFHDLTGNGVNHPNDYGHRIYASVLSELLTEVPFF